MTIKQKETLEELEFRRDVARFVFDMRAFEQLCASKNTTEFNLDFYVKHAIEEHVLDKRLYVILERAVSRKWNPNLIDEYQDDLVKRCRDLPDEISDEVHNLSKEINTFLFTCKNAKSLCGELARAFEFIQKDNYLISEEAAISAMSTLVRDYVKYDEKSAEYTFFRELGFGFSWFYDLYEEYFFKPEVTKEEHAKNFDFLLHKARAGKFVAKELLRKLIPKYAELGISISESTFCRLVETYNSSDVYFTILHMLGENPHVLPTIEKDGKLTHLGALEYLEMLFDELVNGKRILDHGAASPFALGDEEDSLSTADIQNGLKKIILPLCNLMTRTSDGSKPIKEFFVILANKVALLDDSLAIADTISDYLKTLTPDYSSVFDEEYLKASEDLNPTRKNFVLTLKAITEKRTK